MELELNIYKDGKIEKTYTANEYDLMFGTIEDLISLIDNDKLFSNKNEIEIFDSVGLFAKNAFEEIKTLLKDIFPGVTDEELRRTKTKEIVRLFIPLIKFSNLGLGSSKRKN